MYRVSEWIGEADKPHWSEEFPSVDQALTVAEAVWKNAPLDRKGVEGYHISVSDVSEGINVLFVFCNEGRLEGDKAYEWLEDVPNPDPVTLYGTS